MNPIKCSLLVVDDEPHVLHTLSALLATDFEVLTADSADAAKEIFGRREIDLVLTDQRMPGCTGVQLLEWVWQHSPRTVRLIMTGLARLEDAVDAINYGQVHRYLFKPWRVNELRQTLRNAARTFYLERSHEQLLEALRRHKVFARHGDIYDPFNFEGDRNQSSLGDAIGTAGGDRLGQPPANRSEPDQADSERRADPSM